MSGRVVGNPVIRAFANPGEHVAVMFSAPFRPFFLLAALQALIVIGFGPLIATATSETTATAWHAHELLFGYVPAVQAGILLTAIAHWTGRRPLAGAPVAALLTLWLAGRLAIATLGIGSLAAALAAVAFPAALAATLVYEIALARRFSQLAVVLVLIVLVVAQLLFHWEAGAAGRSVFGERLAIAAVMAQFMTMLGLFVPRFTRDFLAGAPQGPLPTPFGRFDVVALVGGFVALAVWIALPALDAVTGPAGALLIAAGLLHHVRQARWCPHRVFAEPLVAVLHAGYAALPLGFLIAGAAILTASPRLAFSTIHVWAIGGTALTTVALMTRASLGHTGRPLRSLAGTAAIYLAIAAALVFRAAGVLVPEWAAAALPIAGLSWIAAYGGFLLIYGPILVRGDALRRAA